MLIHEATNACLQVDGREKLCNGEQKTREHGHSTPEMARRFANKIDLGKDGGIIGNVVEDVGVKKEKGSSKKELKTGKVKCLLLNHFSSRYADPRHSDEAASVMEEIRKYAVAGYDEGEKEESDEKNSKVDVEVVCSYDLMQYEIRARD